LITENPKAQIEFIDPTEAKIHFEADYEEQKRLEKKKKEGDTTEGVSGQFVIEYDVLRDSQGGEIIVSYSYMFIVGLSLYHKSSSKRGNNCYCRKIEEELLFGREHHQFWDKQSIYSYVNSKGIDSIANHIGNQ